MQLTRIAKDAELSMSTTHRILGALLENQLCERGPNGGYRLGLMLLELGKRVQAGLDLRDRSRPLLENLAKTTRLSSFLSVRRGDRAVCIERIEGHDALTMAVEVGGSLPLHVGGMPPVFLAYDTEDEVRSYLRVNKPLQRFTAKTLTESDEIIAKLAESRARGWVLSDEDVSIGVAALGAPVFAHGDSDRPVGVISVSGLRQHVLGSEQKRVLQALLKTADAISDALGASETTFGEGSSSSRRKRVA
jgi:DNA-binding IclR family transcriptional regulator